MECLTKHYEVLWISLAFLVVFPYPLFLHIYPALQARRSDGKNLVPVLQEPAHLEPRGAQRVAVGDSAECDRAKNRCKTLEKPSNKVFAGTRNSGGVIYDLVNRYISPAAREVHGPHITKATETDRKQAGAKQNRELCTGRGEQSIRWTLSKETAAQRCSRTSDCETAVADPLCSGSKRKKRNAITSRNITHIREFIHLRQARVF